MSSVFFFEDECEDKFLLGNKGANLVTMTKLVAAQAAWNKNKSNCRNIGKLTKEVRQSVPMIGTSALP